MNGGNFNIPNQNFAPPGGGGDSGGPNISNTAGIAPGQEKLTGWAKSVAKSQTTRAATTTIKFTRSQFKVFLNQNGMDLITSAVEFQKNGDFIFSSYVLYKTHPNIKEPLSLFLKRYPQYQSAAIAIRDHLKPLQANMQIIS